MAEHGNMMVAQQSEHSPRLAQVQQNRMRRMRAVQRACLSCRIYISEAEMLIRRGLYAKALTKFERVKTCCPHPQCLVACSRCHIQLGSPGDAVRDSQQAIDMTSSDEHPIGTEWEAILVRADAAFHAMDYELALMLYHRGRRLRPNIYEFRLGIIKCEDTILTICDVGFNKTSEEGTRIGNKRDEEVMNPSLFLTRTSTFFRSTTSLKKPLRKLAEIERRVQREKEQSYSRAHACRHLALRQDIKHLRQLRGTRKYISSLVSEFNAVPVPSTKRSDPGTGEDDEEAGTGGSDAQTLSQSVGQFVDSRTLFWRQLLPSPARRELDGWKEEVKSERSRRSQELHSFALREMKKIAYVFQEGRFAECVKKADRFLAVLNRYTIRDLEERDEIVAALHCYRGNCHFELEQYEEAIKAYKSDLAVSKKRNMPKGVARSLDNIGRVHARMGNFRKAINAWMENLQLTESVEEKAWLYHELGYCFLSLELHEDAKRHGQSSFKYATQINDKHWLMNSSNLVGQAEALLGNYEAALEAFQQALDYAKILDDDGVANVVRNAIQDVNASIVARERKRQASETRAAEQSDDVAGLKDDLEQTDAERDSLGQKIEESALADPKNVDHGSEDQRESSNSLADQTESKHSLVDQSKLNRDSARPSQSRDSTDQRESKDLDQTVDLKRSLANQSRSSADQREKEPGSADHRDTSGSVSGSVSERTEIQ